tara:strand:+ start:270 stop:695 length:426 start_codon:yes stop_codon:yes gene_type:complete
MTTPKKPLSKTESAIQLGNVLKYAAGRMGKLRKIGEKATKSASPIKEVKKAKKSLKNQKVDKSQHGKPIEPKAKKALEKKVSKGGKQVQAYDQKGRLVGNYKNFKQAKSLKPSRSGHKYTTNKSLGGSVRELQTLSRLKKK